MKLLNYMGTAATPAQAAAALREKFCNDLANLIMQWAAFEPKPYDTRWRQVAEWGPSGSYGHVPMCPIELPLF